MKKFTFLFVLMLISIGMYAQDQIIKKSKEIINCTIKEVGTEEIKYVISGRPDLILAIDLNKVSKVIFADGREQKFEDEMYNMDNYADQKKHVIKFAMFAPLYDNVRFSYEQNFKPGISFEGSATFIGLGSSEATYQNALGAGFSFGVKFSKEPDYNSPKMRLNNLMAGKYIKPTIAFAAFNHTKSNYLSSYSELLIPSSKASLALMLTAGTQWVYAKTFVVNWYFSIGYGISDAGEGGYYYNYVVAPKEFPIAVGGGLDIGILF